MTKVLVLGAQGMLGSMAAATLSERRDLKVRVTTRGDPPAGSGASRRRFDASSDPVERLLETEAPDWVVNAIAVVAPLIREDDSASVLRAIDVNAAFPRRLADAAAAREQRIIQIATDGVYSGLHGPYDEGAPHDAQDVYGRTKSLGEVCDSHVVLLRCSIVGPEAGPHDRCWAGCSSIHRERPCAASQGNDGTASPRSTSPSCAQRSSMGLRCPRPSTSFPATA